MAKYSQARQPRYSTGRKRRAPRRRAASVGPTPARRRGPAPILIIAAVIVALVFCWIFGRGCGSNQEARENEKLRDYTTAVNKLIGRSAAIGTQFENLRGTVKDLSRDDVNRKLTQMIDASKEIATDSGKVVVPSKALGLQPILQLTFDMRVSGIDKYKSAILDVLDKKDPTQPTATMSQGLLDLVVSDAALERYRADLDAKLKAAKMSYEKITDSVFMPKTDEALEAAVQEYIASLSGQETGNALHGVAVVGLTTSPARVDRTQSGVSILPNSTTFTVKVSVQNQGNQTEGDVPVVVTLTSDAGGTPQKQTQKITQLKAGEISSLVFEGMNPATGSSVVNTVTVKAGPVPNEKKVDNNQMDEQFIMRATG